MLKISYIYIYIYIYKGADDLAQVADVCAVEVQHVHDVHDQTPDGIRNHVAAKQGHPESETCRSGSEHLCEEGKKKHGKSNYVVLSLCSIINSNV